MISTPALLLLLACRRDEKTDPTEFEISDVEDSGTPLDTGEVDTAETDTAETGDTGEPEPETDLRTMAGMQVLSTIVTDPSGFTDNQETAITTSYVLIAWERTGTDVVWTETLCGIESSEVFSTTTSFPDAFVETMPVRARSGTLSEATTGASFLGGPFSDLVSVALDDPEDDDLPTDPDDDRVLDQDGDGEPGVTVVIDNALLGEGEAYVIQRNTSTYEGVIVSAERVEGYLDATSEQEIVSANTWWLELEAPPPEPDPDPTHSYFVMQQVDEGADCADVLSQRGSLF